MVISNLPKIYFDTDPVVDIFLKEIKPQKNKNKNKKIKNAKELWDHWSGEPIKISPYVIGEFIATARSKRYDYSLEEIFNIISNEIIPKCEIIYAKVSPDSKILDMPIFEKYALLRVDFEGKATIFNEPIDQHQVSYMLTKDLFNENWESFDTFTKGIEPGLSFDNKPKIAISSAYFELEFFKKASEFALDYDIPLKDAIHLVYATQEKVDIIVACCEHFQSAAKEIKTKFGIEIYSPEDLLKQLH